MFVVYENNVRCSEFKFSGWDIDSFKSKREAEIFAFMWAYPFTKEEAEMSAPSMELGKDYDFSMCEVPVNMKVVYLPDLIYGELLANMYGCRKSMTQVLKDLKISYETYGVSQFLDLSGEVFLYNCTGDLSRLPNWIEINIIRTHPKTQDLYVW